MQRRREGKGGEEWSGYTVEKNRAERRRGGEGEGGKGRERRGVGEQ